MASDGEPATVGLESAARSRRNRRLVLAGLAALALAMPLASRLLRGRANRPAKRPSTATQDLLHESADQFVNGRYAESIATAQRVLALDPASADAHNNVAVASMKLGRWDEALASIHEALRLRPDLELFRNNLAWIQREKAAAESASPTGEDDSRGAAARFVALSVQHYRLGRWQDAIDAANAALHLDPSSADAHNNVAAASLQLGLWDQAVHHAREALRLSPGLELAQGNLAAAEAGQRKARGASR